MDVAAFSIVCGLRFGGYLIWGGTAARRGGRGEGAAGLAPHGGAGDEHTDGLSLLVFFWNIMRTLVLKIANAVYFIVSFSHFLKLKNTNIKY